MIQQNKLNFNCVFFRALGNMLAIFTQESTKQTLMFLLTAIETFITSTSGFKIMASALVLHEWAKASPVRFLFYQFN